jgi:hypothetical protein
LFNKSRVKKYLRFSFDSPSYFVHFSFHPPRIWPDLIIFKSQDACG